VKHLSYEDAVLGLKKALAVKGEDYVYERPTFELNDGITINACAYFTPEGQPSCIVGHVMADLGHTIDDLAETVTMAGDHTFNTGSTAGMVMDYLGYEIDEKTRSLLSIAQDYQDSGNPWGHAVETAIEFASHVDE
jgi:alkylhydroperoxidase/carboxymuconolactone decarboxylase family protein YurZ